MTNSVDHAVAHEVAAAYLDAADRGGSFAVAAFERLSAEADHLFRWITRPDRRQPLRVAFTTCRNPYRDDQELIAAVADTCTLEVTTVAGDPARRHPVLGNERGGAYDRFRAVHDALGHARMGLGFDRDGEFTVWLAQARFHSALAGRALATELHGQHSVRWTTGEIAEPKAILLEPALVRRAQRLPQEVERQPA
jgi:hypothetical protein